MRISGVNIPTNKKISIALTHIYGISKYRSRCICEKSSVEGHTKVCHLSDGEIKRIRDTITALYKVEGDLRAQVSLNIKNLTDIKSYRGLRHLRRLPVRGQRTHTNARTRKGKAIAIAGKKKITK